MYQRVAAIVVSAFLALLGPADAIGRGLSVVRLWADTTLHAEPKGKHIGTAPAVTPFGQPAHLLVVARDGPWLLVETEALGANGRRAWVRMTSTMQLRQPRYAVKLDLSERRLTVTSLLGVRWRVPASIGAPASPTPIGVFHITDRFSGYPFGGAYGWGVLALSGFQPSLPVGWTGGNRLAIHGMTSPGERIGSAVSGGCPHLEDLVLRRMLEVLPLGTPVTIHP
jgi:hypothetical protein